jgi:hypothetical protein
VEPGNWRVSSRTLKPEREAGTAGVAVLNRNARHMRVGNAPYDCKAEARASRLTAIMTPKTTKQKFALVLVYSRTLIKDPNGSIRHPAVKGVSRRPAPRGEGAIDFLKNNPMQSTNRRRMEAYLMVIDPSFRHDFR